MSKYSAEYGGPAFPPVHNPETHESGMTLRDYFAAAALQGIIAGQLPLHELFTDTKDVVEAQAECSYMIADAMLAARLKEAQ